MRRKEKGPMSGHPKREPNMGLRKGNIPLIFGGSGSIFWRVEEVSDIVCMPRIYVEHETE